MSHHQILKKDPETGEYAWVDVQHYTPNPNDVPHTPAYSESKPLNSRSLAVPRHMVQKYNQQYEDAGLSVRHDADGSLKFTSKTQRNELMRFRGFMDMDAGYGDWAGH